MRATVTLDANLYEKAANLMGINKKSIIVQEGLKALIERESVRRLALLGGSEPQLGSAPDSQSTPG